MRGVGADKNDLFLYLFAAIVSLILSVWVGMREEVINPDAICYVLSAEAFQHGMSKTIHLCGQAKWPFYSILIYALSNSLFLSYTQAAHLLDAIFTAFSVVTFILIVKELGGKKLTLWLAAATILLSHDFNAVREYIIRDHGFWVFYLLSIYLLLRFFCSTSMVLAIGWAASLLIATLFRIEGIIFLFLVPLISWLDFKQSWTIRFNNFLKLNLVSIVVLLTSFAWMFLQANFSLSKVTRLTEVISQLTDGVGIIAWRYEVSKMALAKHVLTQDSIHQAGLLLICLFFIWYVLSIIFSLSWSYALLSMYGWFSKRIKFLFHHKLVLIIYIFTNVLVTLSFLLEHLFLSKRYVLALSLVLMLWVPFAIEDLIQRSTRFKYKLLLWVLLTGIIISSLGGIFNFGYSKKYIREAGDWLSQNVPKDASMYSNDYQLMYYSQHYGDDLFTKLPIYVDVSTISNERWKQYDYLALRLPKKVNDEMSHILGEISIPPVRIFNNKRGDKVVIYKHESQWKKKA